MEKNKLDLQAQQDLHESEEMFSQEPLEDSNQVEDEMDSQVDIDLNQENQSLKQEIEHYKNLVVDLQRQVDENLQQSLRSRADLENFRRRSRKEMEELAKYAVIPLIEALLPIIDNLKRALDAAEGHSDAKGLHQGVEMVYRQLMSSLSKSGLQMIEAEGQPFDPHLHNAVMNVESEMEPGIVVEELQTGYRYHERVVRPSMVKISN